MAILQSNEFKSRFRNHKTSFNNHNHKNATALSKKIWELKENGIDYNITWSMFEMSKAYQAGSRTCNLCLSEKFHIISSKNTINKKSELISKCRHEQKFLLKSITCTSTATIKILLVFMYVCKYMRYACIYVYRKS